MRCQLLKENYFKIFKIILEKSRAARRLKGGKGVREANGITHSQLGERLGSRQEKRISRKVRKVREVIKNRRFSVRWNRIAVQCF